MEINEKFSSKSTALRPLEDITQTIFWENWEIEGRRSQITMDEKAKAGE
jgi:hypothetical protein